MQADHVRFAQQLVERSWLDSQACFITRFPLDIVVDDAQPEPERSFGQRSATSSQADDTERFPGERSRTPTGNTGDATA